MGQRINIPPTFRKNVNILLLKKNSRCVIICVNVIIAKASFRKEQYYGKKNSRRTGDRSFRIFNQLYRICSKEKGNS